jgi:hypothetical protein
MAESEGKAAIHATEAGARKFVDMLVKYLLPIATFFVGAFTGASTWGGIRSFGSLVSQAKVPDSEKVTIWAGAGLFGGMFAAVGYGFWSLDGHLILRAVGRGFGGYFIGVAVSYLLMALGNAALPSGLIDQLVAGIQG